MQRPEPPTFHPTVWPAEPPQVEPVDTWDLRPLEEVGMLEAYSPLNRAAVLPPDFVFRELLHLSATPKGHVATAAQWGLLSLPGAEWRYHRRSPLLPVDDTADIPFHIPLHDGGAIHVDVLTTHLRAAQTLARHTLVHLEGGSGEELVGVWADYWPADSPAQAWSHWEMTMNAALSAYTVHVRAFEDGPSLSRPMPNLYTACCLQIAQYLGADASVKRCANERCGQPFTKQRGTAKYGHRSRGVLYCSPQCAKAQSERDRRRRRAEEKRAQS